MTNFYDRLFHYSTDKIRACPVCQGANRSLANEVVRPPRPKGPTERRALDLRNYRKIRDTRNRYFAYNCT